MRVGIITIPDFNNYGNRLQNYALQKTIENMGFNTVSYVPYKPSLLKCIVKELLKFNEYKYIKEKILNIKRLSNYLKFDKKYVNTKEVRSTKYPDRINSECDCFVAGSDQIWNPMWYTEYSFLQFADNKKKIAYAASFGCDKIPQKSKLIYSNLLSKFRFLSVREKTGKNIIEQLTDQKAKVVLDPTLLLSVQEWKQIEKKPQFKIDKKKYVLTYFLGGIDLNRKNIIEKIALRNNCKIYQLNDKTISHIYKCGPSEFVYLIDNSVFVLTDSFHASVFSIIFHVPFLVFDRLGKGKEMGNRIDTLLSITKLENRKVNENNINIDMKIDFKEADICLDIYKVQSLNFLNDAINNMKKVNLYNNKSQCCGCMACYNICPKHAIKIREDKYGYVYPVIDDERCISCKACLKVCNYTKNSFMNLPIECFAAVAKDEDILLNTASGGVFTAIAKTFLQNGGIVYGCSMELNKDYKLLKHIRVDTIDKLSLLSGSKYAQSNIGDIYKKIKKDLDNNKKVLFSGTPCQVDGLNSFIGKYYKNLVTIDIICHGVPNSKIFFDYLNELEKKIQKKIIEFKFRDKTYGWDLIGSYTCIEPDGSIKKYALHSRDSSYYQYFLGGDIYRENCYTCKYANPERCSDITIGDYWGVEDVHAEILEKNGGCFNKNKGISCILINTNKGKLNFDNTFKYVLNIVPSDYESIRKTNKQLNYTSEKGKLRCKVLKKYNKKGYDTVEKFWIKNQKINLIK